MLKFLNKHILLISISMFLLLGIIIIVNLRMIEDNKYKEFLSNKKQAEKFLLNEKFDDAISKYELTLKYKNDPFIKSKIELSKKLKESHNNYNIANSKFENNDYLEAYQGYLKVISEDSNRYELAQSKSEESKKLYIESIINKSNEFFSKQDYDNAFISIQDIYKIDKDNEDVKKLLKEYADARLKKNEEDMKLAEEKKRIEEEEIKNETERLENKRINNIKNSIKLINYYTSKPNSAGGVDFSVIWKNTSSKTIKYIYFDVIPYNAVNDRQTCDIRRNSTFRGKVTGPIESGVIYGERTAWDCAWYNNTIKYIEIESISIDYIDGTNLKIEKKDMIYVK